MSYTVLARKYRSRTLDEIVGQDPIVTTLKNAITSGKIHHGFLFCGTRGVGKTSTARVLAKSLNCLRADAPTVTPCCECDSCVAIAKGEDLDVIEIDAASNTGVDNIRDLRSNVSYRPARSRYKVYIIDEVHMLSTGAFNALLKTLEEPPEHVKFIFATTEPQKVPETVQSRVQRYEFQSIPAAVIAEQLRSILQSEKIEADDAVIRRVARSADGSMRDGLSLLDQLLSFGQDRLDIDLVDEILPTPHDMQLSKLVECFASEDAAAALEATDQYLSGGRTHERFCENMINHLRMLMVVRVCGPETDLVDVPTAVEETVSAHSQAFDAQTFVYMITVMEELRRQVRSSGAGRALIDAAIVRLTCAHNFTSISEMREILGDGDHKAPKKKLQRGEQIRPLNKSTLQPEVSPHPTADLKQVDRAVSGARVAESPAQIPKDTQSAAPIKVTSKEIRAARSDPLVQEALSLFDGTLMNVQRATAAPSPPEVVQSPEKGEGD